MIHSTTSAAAVSCPLVSSFVPHISFHAIRLISRPNRPQICPTSHPNLVTFAHALHKEAERVLQRMDDVAKGREVPPEYNEPIFPEIPPEFYGNAKRGGKKGRGKK